MQYGKGLSFGSKSEYIIYSIMELGSDFLLYSFCERGGEVSYLRALNLSTSEPLWTFQERPFTGYWGVLHNNYLIGDGQIVEADTGHCLFDFGRFAGLEACFYFVELDDHRLMFELSGKGGVSSYVVVDTRTWQADELVAMDMSYLFKSDGVLYGWRQSKGSTELCRFLNFGGVVNVVYRIEFVLELRSTFFMQGYVFFTCDYCTWFRVDVHSGARYELPLSGDQDEVFHCQGMHAGKVYFSSCSGLREYSLDNDGVRIVAPNYVTSVCVFNGALYGVEHYEDELGNERSVPFALDSVVGDRLWEGPSLRNCNLLKVNDRGVFVGTAGGKIHYFPAPGYEIKRISKVAKPKKKAARPALDLSLSPYALLLTDPAGLQQAIQRKVLDEGKETSVVAVAVSTDLGLAAFIEYDDDPDFPQLRLLDLQADSILDINSSDLIDAPMIDEIAFVDDGAKLRLSFRNDQNKVVTLDLSGRAVTWD